jgi:hypothetical protein
MERGEDDREVLLSDCITYRDAVTMQSLARWERGFGM